MHELSIAESLLQIIEDTATERHFLRVKVVWLEIGQLACVEQESLRFYFDVVIQGSIAHTARLEIIDIAGQAHCHDCNRHCAIASYDAACPYCGSVALTVTQGEAMRIKELEVE